LLPPVVLVGMVELFPPFSFFVAITFKFRLIINSYTQSVPILHWWLTIFIAEYCSRNSDKCQPTTSYRYGICSHFPELFFLFGHKMAGRCGCSDFLFSWPLRR
jgi:hypothetical protein